MAPGSPRESVQSCNMCASDFHRAATRPPAGPPRVPAVEGVVSEVLDGFGLGACSPRGHRGSSSARANGIAPMEAIDGERHRGSAPWLGPGSTVLRCTLKSTLPWTCHGVRSDPLPTPLAAQEAGQTEWGGETP